MTESPELPALNFPEPVPPPGPGWRYGPLFLVGAAVMWLLIEGLGFGPQTASQLENDAVALSLAAQQNTRLARLTEAFSRWHDPEAGVSIRTLAVGELRETAPLVTEGLQRLRNGGPIPSTTGTNSFPLRPQEDAQALQTLQTLETAWKPLGDSIDSLVSSSEMPPRAAVLAAAEKYQAALPELHQGLTQLAGDLGTQTRSRTQMLRWVQAGALALSLSLGALLWYLSHRRIRQAETLVEKTELLVRQTRSRMELNLAKTNGLLQENALLLATVQQGLLVVDPKFRIGNAYSKECESLFQQENLGGTSLLTILQKYLPEKLLNTTRDYLELLFNPAKKEKALLRINPLREIEVNLPQAGGSPDVRHWEFGFRRVPDGRKVGKVFVSVHDVTESVRLRQELQAAEKTKERQFEILANVLQVDPGQFREFLEQAELELDRLDSLPDPAAPGEKSPAAQRQRLDAVFRAAHSIKGHAAFIGANSFVATVHEFEEQIQKLRARSDWGAEDLAVVNRQQAALVRDLALARAVVTRLGTFRQLTAASSAANPAATPSKPSSTTREIAPPQSAPAAEAEPAALIPTLNQLLQKLAAQLGKQVRLDTSEFASNLLPERQSLVREILIQLGRNSLAHGIESPAERRTAGKPPTGTITLSLEPDDDTSPGGVALVYRDDGRGLEPERIRAKARALELLPPDELAALDDSEAVLLIFEPGFSTAEVVDELAGRGVGLDLLRRRVVDDLGGEISVDSVPGQFCEFRFHLPSVEAPHFA